MLSCAGGSRRSLVSYRGTVPTLEHPQTDVLPAIRRPLRVALRNSIVSVAVLGIAAALIVAWLNSAGKPLDVRAAWLAGASVAAGAVVICCGHAFLGAKIGAHRANNFFRALLAAALVVFLFWLRQVVGR